MTKLFKIHCNIESILLISCDETNNLPVMWVLQGIMRFAFLTF